MDKIMKKILTFIPFAAAALLSSGWLDNNFSKRTEIDTDTFRHPEGREMVLTLDAKRLEKACKEEFAPGKIKLSAVDAEGKEKEVAFYSSGVDKVDNKLRLVFVKPAGKLFLYFGGSGKSADSACFDVLDGKALSAKNYRSDGFFKASAQNGVMNLKQSRWTSNPDSDVYVEQIFPIAPKYAGMPVTLIFDAKSNSKAMWPLAIDIVNLDAKRRIIGQRVCDLRWATVQTVPGKAFHQRLEGHIDPNAKYLRIRLRAARAGQKRLFDTLGKPLADTKSSLPDIDIKRFVLIPGNHAALPGANPELYIEGVKKGTSALKLAGNTSPLFNNFSAVIWSESGNVRKQNEMFWPLGTDGTAEFYVKFDKLPKRPSVLLENGRNGKPAFLRLEVKRDMFFVKFNGYDQPLKNGKERMTSFQFSKTVPAKLSTGKWTHVAVTWDKNGVALFVDGKKLMSETIKIAPVSAILKNQSRTNNIAEYTAFGADTHRFTSGNPVGQKYLEGAVDELRISKKVRYTADFTPAKEFKVDSDTCALFSYEKNFDGKCGFSPGLISGSIYAADVPPKADILKIETRDGKNSVVRYVPKNIPDSNIPQYFIRETSYPVLPTPEDFKMARVSKSVTKTLRNGQKIEFTAAKHAVPEYVEVKATTKPVKAPFLRHHGEIDARSFADVANSIDFSDCPDEHSKARKAFDFLVSSTDYFTFSAADFPRYSDVPIHAGSHGLVAINSYAAFQCGPLNGIASGLYVNGLGFPAVLTFGNGHLFQQVMLNGKLRVFDLSAQQYFPSRNQDDAASLDELERDIYLFQRTRRPVGGASHFFRMGKRGSHTVANAPRERLEYTLYPGESFRYYPANNGLSNDLNSLDWRGKTWESFLPTWENFQKETNAAVEVGRVIQRPLPHTSNGIYFFNGKVSPGAFSDISSNGFCFRIDSPYTIICGAYSVPDKNATFEVSYDKGASWKPLKSEGGVCKVEYALRGRHVALLKVNTSSRTFKAMTVTQMSPRRQTGLAREGKNSILFTSDEGEAQVTIAYRERAKEISLDGGFYFGVVPGIERQLFTLEPGKSRTIKVNGVSSKAAVKTSGALKAVLAGNKLTVTAPSDIQKGVHYIVITDGKAVKAADFLVCKGVREYSVKDLKPAKVRRQQDKLETRKADANRVQDVVKGQANIDVSNAAPGKYVVFTLTRRDNRNNSVMQATIWNGKQDLVAARTRNPGFEYYKATYGPFPARWEKRTAKENSIDPWSRFRWDIATGKDTYPRVSNMPLETEIKAGNKALTLAAHTECAGVILLPSDDKFFMYMTARNLLSMNRADWMFNTLE